MCYFILVSRRRVGLKKLSTLRTDPRYHYNPNIDRFKKEEK